MILTDIFGGIRFIATYALVFVFCVIGGWLFIQFVKRKRLNERLEDAQKLMLAKGRINRRKYRLKDLFTSDIGGKMRSEGKIAGYLLIETQNSPKKKQEVFIIRTKQEYRFFLVNPERRTELTRDVTLFDWNYNYDNKDGFWVVNTEKEKTEKPMLKAIETLKELQPMVATAINSNPIHRIVMRERKLAKQPMHDASLLTGGQHGL